MTYNILSLTFQGATQKNDVALNALHTALSKRGDDLIVTNLSIHSQTDLSQIYPIAKKAHAIFCNCPPQSHPISALCEKLNIHTRLTRIKNSRLDVIVASDTYGGLDKNDSGYKNNSTFGREAYDVIRYSELEIERTARIAFELAQERKKTLCLSDKATCLLSSKLWRKILADINEDYPRVYVNALDFDEAVLKSINTASSFDILLAPRFLADTHTSILCAQENTLSSTCFVGDTTFGIYCLSSNNSENLLSTSFCLRHCFDLKEQANEIENQILAL